MNKLGIGCTPILGDYVEIKPIHGESCKGTVVNWGAEAWGQNWATIKTDDGQQIQTNIAHIVNFGIIKRAQADLQLVKKEGQMVKSAQKIVSPTNPMYRIKRGTPKEHVISRPISKSDKSVEEPETSLPKLEGDVISQAQTLANLYNQKRKLTQKNVSDHMKRKDLIEVEDNYGMPSFKKHP